MPARAYFYLVVTTLLWGGNTAFGKMAVGHVSPMMLNLSRWTIAFFVITLISLPQLRRDWPEMRRHWLLLIAYGTIGYTGFAGLLYLALKYTSAVNGAIEQGGIPVLIFIINFVFFRIPVSLVQIAGFLISFVGVALTASHGDLATLLELTLNYGDALLLLAALAYAVYTVALRWRPNIHWRSLMTGSAFGATLSAVPLLFWEARAGNLILPDALGFGIIAYIALLPSLISQILYVKGVEVIGANRAGLFINLVPVFGTLLSILLLGESLQLFHVVAMILVLGGIAIAEWGKPAERA
ncbi:DMT family transporter [Pseudomonas sp. R2.Fl]|nr:DMT family transporter [Pseudomonas sp. R2.Fl]